jgi:hypothetical protein
VDLEPGIRLEAAQEAGQSRPSADASDLDFAKAHIAIGLSAGIRRLISGPTGVEDPFVQMSAEARQLSKIGVAK